MDAEFCFNKKRQTLPRLFLEPRVELAIRQECAGLIGRLMCLFSRGWVRDSARGVRAQDASPASKLPFHNSPLNHHRNCKGATSRSRKKSGTKTIRGDGVLKFPVENKCPKNKLPSKNETGENWVCAYNVVWKTRSIKGVECVSKVHTAHGIIQQS